MMLKVGHPSSTQIPSHLGSTDPSMLPDPSPYPPLRQSAQSHGLGLSSSDSNCQSPACGCLKKEHGSFSSASTNSSHLFPREPSRSPVHLSPQCLRFPEHFEPRIAASQIPSTVYSNGGLRPTKNEMIGVNIIYRDTIESGKAEEQVAEDHAVRILIWLSVLEPLYCILTAVYTLAILFPLLLATPIRLCRPSLDLSRAVVCSIGPVHKRRLGFLRQRAKEGDGDGILDFKALSLIMVSLTAPLLSLGVAFATWISAGFWIFAITMGNPDGTERRDDGRATVLGVRNRWERFLLCAAR